MFSVEIWLGIVATGIFFFVAVLALFFWKIARSLEALEKEARQTLTQVQMSLEKFRENQSALRQVLDNANRCTENVLQVTEGVKRFRKTLDAATGVLDHFVHPVLAGVAGGIAGTKAAVSHAVKRWFGKEE